LSGIHEPPVAVGGPRVPGMKHLINNTSQKDTQ